MYTVDLYLRVRLACHVDGLSQREAASRFGIARETVRKMLRHSEPPGYRRRQPPKRPKLAPFTDIIDRILEEDRPVHRKQHHTAKRTEVFRGIDADPLVRFSNLLEAIFFSTSIVCENEADCLFYRNLCRVIDPAGNDNEVFWLSAHGKQNIKKFVFLLRQLGLAVISIPDLDIINDQTNLRTLFESHGGTWANIQADYLTLARLMKERKPTVSAEGVTTKIGAALTKGITKNG